MLLKILQAGDKHLSRAAKPVSLVHLKQPETQALINLMVATLRDKPGVGLAAPQVGEPLQIIVIEDKKKYSAKVPQALLAAQGRNPVALKVFVNPKVEIIEEAKRYFFEGCLSIEGYRAVVPRAKKVKVSGLDRHGQKISMVADGWLARIVQHEVDHLSGRLYIERMYPRSFISEAHFSKNWAEAGPEKLEAYISHL
jgi:peptide deformylase